MRAFYYLYHDWDFEKAELEYKSSLNSVQPESYALYADYLNFVRRHDEAIRILQEIFEIEDALHWLRIAIDDHEMEIPWLISEPQFFNLHDHQIFKNLVEEVGFPS